MLLSVTVALKLYVVAIAPGILVKVDPLLVDTCHCTVPLFALALNEAVVPAQNVALVGLALMLGTVVTVSVAALLVAEPQLAVKTARY